MVISEEERSLGKGESILQASNDGEKVWNGIDLTESDADLHEKLKETERSKTLGKYDSMKYSSKSDIPDVLN